MFERKKKRRSPRKLLSALALLLLILAMLFLSSYFVGVLPGGGDLPDPERAAALERRPGTLKVTVLRAENRQPVQGASIIAIQLTGGEARAQSDGEGHVLLEGLGEGPVRVEASFQGERASAWADPGHGEGVQLAVEPEKKRRGVVRHADGSPAKATVRLVSRRAAELARTETDDSGRYELPDLAEGIAVSAQGARGAPATAFDGDLVLRDGEMIEGRFTGAGRGTLAVYGLVPAARDDAVLPLRAQWEVDAEGRYRGHLPAGAVAWALFDGLPVPLGEDGVALPRRVTAAGQVLRSDGKPAAHALLLFRPLLDQDFPTMLPGLKVQADAGGRFEATGFADTRYAVEVRAAGCAARVVPEMLPGRQPLEITLDPGYAIHGFVVDTGGLPVAEARVQAAGLPDTDGERPLLDVRTDDQGRFHLAGLGGTHARVRVTAPGHHATTLERVDREAQLRIVLQPQ